MMAINNFLLVPWILKFSLILLRETLKTVIKSYVTLSILPLTKKGENLRLYCNFRYLILNDRKPRNCHGKFAPCQESITDLCRQNHQNCGCSGINLYFQPLRWEGKRIKVIFAWIGRLSEKEKKWLKA